MIPLATTTVDVAAVTETEPGEGTTTTARASDVRAVIGAPAGREQPAPGAGAERIDAVLNTDPITGLRHGDTVVDTETGDTYRVAWVQQRPGMLAHTRAGLVRTDGKAAA